MAEEFELPSDWQSLHSMPELAGLLRDRKTVILERWTHAVERLIPDADPLTAREVRDTIPLILDQMAEAFASSTPPATENFFKISRAHGVTRYHQAYNVREVVAEYRLLRGILIDEAQKSLGARFTVERMTSLNTAVDIALQQAVVAFVEFQNAQIKAVTESQSKYLSFLSHDLRNNLNGVMLTMEVLSRSLGKMPEFQEDVADIKNMQRAMSETIAGMDRLLQAEKLRKRTGKITFRAVRLMDPVDDVVRQATRLAQEKGLTLKLEVPATAVVNGDRELITLLLQNVLGNAVKYSTQGTVTVKAELRAGASQEWIVSVTDEGPGIPPEQLGNLFNAFSRGATYGQAGVGLGLAIASQAALAMASDLRLESEVGRGTTFHVALPAHTPDA